MKAWNLLKTNFKTCQLDENRLFICWFQTEHNWSGEKRQTNAGFVDDALKTRGIKYLNVQIWLLYSPPPDKLSGYAPGASPFSEYHLPVYPIFHV